MKKEQSVICEMEPGTELILTLVPVEIEDAEDDEFKDEILEDEGFKLYVLLESVRVNIDLKFNGNLQQIGSVLGHLFHEPLDLEENWLEIDSIDVDLSTLATELITNDSIPFMSSDGMVSRSFLYLDRIFIKEEFRNKGFGEKILNNLQNLFDFEIGGIMLLACPTENFKNKTQKAKAKKRLVNFYERNGFMCTKLRSINKIMYKVLDPNIVKW